MKFFYNLGARFNFGSCAADVNLIIYVVDFLPVFTPNKRWPTDVAVQHSRPSVDGNILSCKQGSVAHSLHYQIPIVLI